jgi:hypothetical protein
MDRLSMLDEVELDGVFAKLETKERKHRIEVPSLQTYQGYRPDFSSFNVQSNANANQVPHESLIKSKI